MVRPSNRDVRLEQIREGAREPRRPSDTIEAQVPWLAVGAGSLIGLGADDIPVIGGMFDSGGGGGGLSTQIIILAVLVILVLLFTSGTLIATT